jgi:hypothetical protein
VVAAQQIRLEKLVADEERKAAEWKARRAAGQRVTRPPLPPGTSAKARKAAARLEKLKAAEADREAAQAEEDGGKRQPARNVTGPGSRLLPARGGGFIQGFNCQDGTADDRLMLGGYACQDINDQLQAARPAPSWSTAPPWSRPPAPPTPATRMRSRPAAGGCAPSWRSRRTAPIMTPPPATTR